MCFCEVSESFLGDGFPLCDTFLLCADLRAELCLYVQPLVFQNSNPNLNSKTVRGSIFSNTSVYRLLDLSVMSALKPIFAFLLITHNKH